MTDEEKKIVSLASKYVNMTVESAHPDTQTFSRDVSWNYAQFNPIANRNDFYNVAELFLEKAGELDFSVQERMAFIKFLAGRQLLEEFKNINKENLSEEVKR